MNWNRLLAYITGSVDQELLLRNEYLVTENRILRNQIKGRIRLKDPELHQPGRDCQASWPEGAGRCSTDRPTGNHPWVAPSVDRQEVRRLNESITGEARIDGRGDGTIGVAVGP
jgi:hypothetical protein